MKQSLFLSIALAATLILSACGGQEPAEQTVMDMPTPIPTYTPQAAIAASQEKAPAVEEETPEAEASATEETAAGATPAEEETPAPVDESETPEAEDSAMEEATAGATQAEEAAETVADDPLAGLPTGVAAAMADADPGRGEQLTLQNACIGCHSFDPNAPMVGPTWDNLAETAANRVEGENAAEYLYHSIVDPNAYVVEGFPPNVMLQNYADTFSDQDLADLITYLLNAGQ